MTLDKFEKYNHDLLLKSVHVVSPADRDLHSVYIRFYTVFKSLL